MSTARINERLVPCFQNAPRSQVLAVASRSRERAEACAKQWGIPQAYDSYDALLDDPQLDAIYISLPNHLHATWSVRAANAGKHVLCEKPLALTVGEVDEIEQAAQRSGVVVQEAAMMRYHPQIDKVRELIAAGNIGAVRLARGMFTFTLDRPADIRLSPLMGGGSLWDLGTYCVRWFRTVLAAEPVEVYAGQVTDTHGVDASLGGQLHFEHGMMAQFYSSFAAFTHTEADVLGTRGRLELDMPWVNLLHQPAYLRWVRTTERVGTGTFSDGVGKVEEGVLTFADVNAYQDQVNSMVRSILDGAPPKLPLSDSRNNTAVIVALLESARVNYPIRVQAHSQPLARGTKH